MKSTDRVADGRRVHVDAATADAGKVYLGAGVGRLNLPSPHKN